MKKEVKTMNPVTPEDQAVFDDIAKQIGEHKAAIRTLIEQAKTLAAKYVKDFKECREIGCIHTYHKVYACDESERCLRARLCNIPVKDYYQAPAPVIKTVYPTLGWKTVTRGVKKKDSDELDIRKVIKETPCFLFVEGSYDPLHKRNLKKIEDCYFLSGYFCADDVDAIQYQKALLDVQEEEDREASRRFMERMLNGGYQVDPNKIFNPIKKESETNG
jgi:hypothetical protein